MDWNWAVQLLLAITSVVWERRNELLESKRSEDDFSIGQSSHRQPRIAAVPPGAPITIGLIYVFPTTVIVIFRRRRLADFNELGKKKKEGEVTLDENGEGSTNSSTSSNSTSAVTITDVSTEKPDASQLEANDDVDDAAGEKEEEARGLFDTWQLDNDVLHEDQLSKLDTYFYQFDIESDRCRRRIVCQLAAAPESFYPISDIVLRQIKPKVPVTPSKRSRFYQYLEAAKIGFNGDTKACEKIHKCNYGAEDIFDDRVLRLFHLLGRELNIEFVDYE